MTGATGAEFAPVQSVGTAANPGAPGQQWQPIRRCMGDTARPGAVHRGESHGPPSPPNPAFPCQAFLHGHRQRPSPIAALAASPASRPPCAPQARRRRRSCAPRFHPPSHAEQSPCAFARQRPPPSGLPPCRSRASLRPIRHSKFDIQHPPSPATTDIPCHSLSMKIWLTRRLPKAPFRPDAALHLHAPPRIKKFSEIREKSARAVTRSPLDAPVPGIIRKPGGAGQSEAPPRR